MTSEYHYIGKDGKTVLARDLEDERDALKARVAELEEKLDDARAIAACAAQSWRCNDFDVEGNQRNLFNLGLKWSGNSMDDESGKLEAQCVEVRPLVWRGGGHPLNPINTKEGYCISFKEDGEVLLTGGPENTFLAFVGDDAKEAAMTAAQEIHNKYILYQVTTRSASEVWQEAISAVKSTLIHLRDNQYAETEEATIVYDVAIAEVDEIPNPYEVKE